MLPIPSSVGSSIHRALFPESISSAKLDEILRQLNASMHSLHVSGGTYASETSLPITVDTMLKAIILDDAKRLIPFLEADQQIFMLLELVNFEIEINLQSAKENLAQLSMRAERLENPEKQGQIFFEIVKHEVKFDLSAAINTAEKIIHPKCRSKAFYEIVMKEVKVDIQSAKKRAENISDVFYRDFAEIEILKEALMRGGIGDFSVTFTAHFECWAFLEIAKIIALRDLEGAKERLQMSKEFAMGLDPRNRSLILKEITEFEMTFDPQTAKQTTLLIPSYQGQAEMFLKIAKLEYKNGIDPKGTLALAVERIDKIPDADAVGEIYLKIVKIAVEMNLQQLPELIEQARNLYWRIEALFIAVEQKKISLDIVKNMLEEMRIQIGFLQSEDRSCVLCTIAEIEAELGFPSAYETLVMAKKCASQIDDFEPQNESFLAILHLEAEFFPERIQTSIQGITTFLESKEVPQEFLDNFIIETTKIMAEIDPQWAKECARKNPRLKDKILLRVASAEGRSQIHHARETAAQINNPLMRIKALFAMIQSVDFLKNIHAIAG